MLVYIHIPFCDSKCSYCAFNSYVDKFHLKQAYIDALHTQLLDELQKLSLQKGDIETIFIGGGTPSTLHPSMYTKIFQTLLPYCSDTVEITSEANPNSATKEWLEGMYALGVNRISFGVQSFDQNKLKLLHRAHTPQMAQEALINAHKVGFTNLSLDLIYGVAGDSTSLLLNDLTYAFDLPINHLSAYALTIEEATPFAKTPEVAQEKLTDTLTFFDAIKAHGFVQYEISNFGTYKSQHNLGYWYYKDYLGLGAGAVGKYANNRYYPHQSVEAYIKDPLFRTFETLDQEAIKTEKIFLGFRSEVGVALDIFTPQELQKVTLLLKEKKLVQQDTRVFTDQFLLADELTLFITS